MFFAAQRTITLWVRAPLVMTGGVFLSQKKEYKRPDEAALLRIMEDNRDRLAETLVVLAWRLGLSREEIYHLKWTDISFEERQVNLPDRSIPMDEEAYTRLYRRWENQGQRGRYVASSDRHAERVHLNYIPRCVRLALNEGGLPDINLIDLRQDFVIRLLQKHPWPYVVRVSGITTSTLHQSYPQYVQSVRGKPEEREETPQVDRGKLWTVIQEAGTSVEGLALRMNWQMGMQLQEVAALTWDQMDFENHVICLNGEDLPMPADLEALLARVHSTRSSDDDPHVLLSVKARRPIAADRLSVLVRTALIQGGIEDMTLAELLQKKRAEDDDDAILQFAAMKGALTKNDVMSEFQLSKMQAFARLRRLTEQKKLIRIGTTYYIPGTVVPPEEHYGMICALLEETGGAYRQDIADLLQLEPRKCGWILAQLVREGKLSKVGQLYMLPQDKTV